MKMEDNYTEASSSEEEHSVKRDNSNPITMTVPKKLLSFQIVRKSSSLEKIKLQTVRNVQSQQFKLDFIEEDKEKEKEKKKRIHVDKYLMSFHSDVIAHCGQISNPKAEDRMAFGHFKGPGKEENLATFISLFDGHGGSLCAKYVSENLGHFMKEKLKKVDLLDPKKVEIIMFKIIRSLEKKWFSLSNHDTSGTTALILLYFKQMIYILNVGDSRAVYISGDLNSIENLCTEQSVKKPHEIERLKKTGIQLGYKLLDSANEAILTEKELFQFYFQKDKSGQKISKLSVIVPTKVNKKYNKDISLTSIAVTSTIGDVRFGPIIAPYPVISFRKVAAKCLVLLATDGLWDVMSNDEVLLSIKNISLEINPDRLPLDSLERDVIDRLVRLIQVRLTREAWHRYGSPGCMRDDITVIIACL